MLEKVTAAVKDLRTSTGMWLLGWGNRPKPASALKTWTHMGLTASGLITPSSFPANSGFVATLVKGNETERVGSEDKDRLTGAIKHYLDKGWTLRDISPLKTILPTISGLTRTYKSFKPAKVVLVERLAVTYGGKDRPDLVVHTVVEDAADLVLTAAFAGADNCFPNAPTQSSGIAGQVFANNSLMEGFSWPTINGGIDMTVSFAVQPSVLTRVSWPVSGQFEGYDPLPHSICVEAHLNMLGPSLR